MVVFDVRLVNHGLRSEKRIQRPDNFMKVKFAVLLSAKEQNSSNGGHVKHEVFISKRLSADVLFNNREIT